MSEATSTGGAPSGSAAPGTAAQGSSPNPGPGGGQAPQAQGAANPNQAPGQTQEQRRVLAEQDFDAYIEHTVNGKKEQIKVRDLAKSYGLDKTANQRMQEAAQIKRQQHQDRQLMQTDFNKWCEVNGVDKKAFLKSNLERQVDIAEEVLAAQYERSQMDPHQREALELKEQLKSIQDREMNQKRPLIDEIKKLVPADRLPRGLENATIEQLKEYHGARQQEFQQGLDNLSTELLEAWQKVGLPKEKDFGAWMAQTMLDHQRQARAHYEKTGEQIQPLLPEQAAAKVKSRFLKSTQSLLSQMDAPAIHEVLGEAIIQKLRDHDTRLASQGTGPKFGEQNNSPGLPPASEPKKQLNQTEWRRQVLGIV